MVLTICYPHLIYQVEYAYFLAEFINYLFIATADSIFFLGGPPMQALKSRFFYGGYPIHLTTYTSFHSELNAYCKRNATG